MFALRKFLVLNRLWIGLLLIGLGIWSGIEIHWGLGWLPILIGVLTIVAHFLVGPITLVQRYFEAGDVEGVQKLMNNVKYPNLLYKPIRSMFFSFKSMLSTMNNDLDAAEADIRKSMASGIQDKDMQATSYTQLGEIAYRKGNMKEAYSAFRKAVELGIPDGDGSAKVYINLAGICIQRRDYRGGKFYYNKAKSMKSKNAEIVNQLNEMKKYISRIPG